MASNDDEDECDYMSDAFVEKCANVRPGLVPDRVTKQLEREKKQKEANVKSKTKPLKVQEQEKRDEGLKVSISSDNKGFAMLQKMGYKAGMGIGKEGNKGRKEPVPIEIRHGRGGLGRDTELKRKHNQMQSYREMMKVKQARRSVEQQKDFRHRMASMMSEKRVHGDLMKSQKVCEQLDVDNKGLDKPVRPYFWPAHLQKSAADDEEDDDFAEDDNEPATYYKHPPAEEDEEQEEEEVEEEVEYDIEESDQLIAVTEYLRTAHFYCLWCGTAYNDADDLDDNCPGDTAEDHG